MARARRSRRERLEAALVWLVNFLACRIVVNGRDHYFVMFGAHAVVIDPEAFDDTQHLFDESLFFTDPMVF